MKVIIACRVLLKVQATTLNPAGYKLVGAVPNFLAGWLHVAEQDVAGIVVAPNGLRLQPLPALAEYVALPSSPLVLIPPNVSAVEAAGLGIAVERGQTVFKVVTTARGKNKDLLLSLDVDEFIDYTEAPLVEQLSKPPTPKFHAIFDAVSLTDPALYLNSTCYLTSGGMYLSAGALSKTRKEITDMLRQLFEVWLRPAWLGGVPRKYAFVPPSPRAGDLETRTVRDLVRPFLIDTDRNDVMQAYEKLMSKHAVGKVVIKVANEQ
ncbi:hypothetical protein B0H17DRAFT_1170985 [Mycena rosella]|uniref:Uncharacterized protein n=1 Tax=Mycena rosella TaxID=1033263 RepID=A0AAD7CZ82_MYCRO|nr:hypothetical protein B0H17DRAFT_1170985 [Mycena rosella]